MKPLTITEIVNKKLDLEYKRISAPMLTKVKAISAGQSSEMQKALRELDVEASRLDENGEKLSQDNKVLKKALVAYGAVLVATRQAILTVDAEIQLSGQVLAVPAVTAKVLPKVTESIIARGLNPLSEASHKIFVQSFKSKGMDWKMPKDTVLSVSDFIEGEAWSSKMANWPAGYSNMTKQTVLQGIQEGWNPRHTANVIRQHAQNVPQHAAENLTRTLQLTSYREASLAMESFNGEFIEYKIRIATLDDRTCLSCIALHGTRLEVGERVDDHYRGRCTEFYVVPGGDTEPAFMQSDSTPGKRKFVPFESGEAWFANLPPERQARQASFKNTPAKLKAYLQNGQLSDFVGDHEDPVFGHQHVERSLKQAYEAPEAYYVRSKFVVVEPRE